jgi:hypothetical protein
MALTILVAYGLCFKDYKLCVVKIESIKNSWFCNLWETRGCCFYFPKVMIRIEYAVKKTENINYQYDRGGFVFVGLN